MEAGRKAAINRIGMRSTKCCIGYAACAFNLLAPTVSYAELSNDSLLGPGERSRPAYDGSAAQVHELVPVIRYFGTPWFLRTTQEVLEGGVRMPLAAGIHAGGQLAYEPGREPGESNFLLRHRVSYIKRGASLGAQVEWDRMVGPMPITLLGRARQNTDLTRGAQIDLRLSAGAFKRGRVAMGVFTQATWANQKASKFLYGVTEQQSTATGLPAFAPGSGWLFASLGLLGSVDLGSNWLMVGSASARHMYGDSARSPLTERLSSWYGTAGLAYRF